MVQSLIMKKLFLILFGLYFSVSFSQETILVLNKIDQNKFNLDGVVTENEIDGAKIL